MTKDTAGAIKVLQEDLSETAPIAEQNRMALVIKLASQGGVSTIVNTICEHVDECGRISTDFQEIWK